MAVRACSTLRELHLDHCALGMREGERNAVTESLRDERLGWKCRRVEARARVCVHVCAR